ncbi:hypothetical protein BJ742DRAFT_737026 [Cladochytrium replicatum]|nr:hypothetical protein BJ742DRAFT_737026 [Cladochytrium replicatum]
MAAELLENPNVRSVIRQVDDPTGYPIVFMAISIAVSLQAKSSDFWRKLLLAQGVHRGSEDGDVHDEEPYNITQRFNIPLLACDYRNSGVLHRSEVLAQWKGKDNESRWRTVLSMDVRQLDGTERHEWVKYEKPTIASYDFVEIGKAFEIAHGPNSDAVFSTTFSLDWTGIRNFFLETAIVNLFQNGFGRQPEQRAEYAAMLILNWLSISVERKREESGKSDVEKYKCDTVVALRQLPKAMISKGFNKRKRSSRKFRSTIVEDIKDDLTQ